MISKNALISLKAVTIPFILKGFLKIFQNYYKKVFLFIDFSVIIFTVIICVKLDADDIKSQYNKQGGS